MRRQEYAMAVQAIRSRAFYSHTLMYSFLVHALELHYLDDADAVPRDYSQDSE